MAIRRAGPSPACEPRAPRPPIDGARSRWSHLTISSTGLLPGHGMGAGLASHAGERDSPRSARTVTAGPRHRATASQHELKRLSHRPRRREPGLLQGVAEPDRGGEAQQGADLIGPRCRMAHEEHAHTEAHPVEVVAPGAHREVVSPEVAVGEAERVALAARSAAPPGRASGGWRAVRRRGGGKASARRDEASAVPSSALREFSCVVVARRPAPSGEYHRGRGSRAREHLALDACVGRNLRMPIMHCTQDLAGAC